MVYKLAKLSSSWSVDNLADPEPVRRYPEPRVPGVRRDKPRIASNTGRFAKADIVEGDSPHPVTRRQYNEIKLREDQGQKEADMDGEDSFGTKLNQSVAIPEEEEEEEKEENMEERGEDAPANMLTGPSNQKIEESFSAAVNEEEEDAPVDNLSTPFGTVDLAIVPVQSTSPIPSNEGTSSSLHSVREEPLWIVEPVLEPPSLEASMADDTSAAGLSLYPGADKEAQPTFSAIASGIETPSTPVAPGRSANSRQSCTASRIPRSKLGNSVSHRCSIAPQHLPNTPAPSTHLETFLAKSVPASRPARPLQNSLKVLTPTRGSNALAQSTSQMRRRQSSKPDGNDDNKQSGPSYLRPTVASRGRSKLNLLQQARTAFSWRA